MIYSLYAGKIASRRGLERRDTGRAALMLDTNWVQRVCGFVTQAGCMRNVEILLSECRRGPVMEHRVVIAHYVITFLTDLNSPMTPLALP